MNDRILYIYHRLPAPLRSTAASLRGLYLKWWRYGAETESLVESALERETWGHTQWKTWQEERLAYVLHRAATLAPYYREQWAERRRSGDRSSWEHLENWSILEKDAIRSDPEAFVCEDCDVRRMFQLSTSGTTGKPLKLFESRQTVRALYALFEARCRVWHGVTRRDRCAVLGGQLVTAVTQRHPPYWVWNASLNQLYMSSYHLAPDCIPHYLDALSRYRVSYLEGYTSSLYALAQEALRIGRRDLAMSVAITNAEPVYDYQREAISEAFQCPVRETYGMAESVAAASECDHGHLHQWPEAGWIEAVAGNRAVAAGTPGDLVCTGLLNADMPLIRYRVGDRGTVPNASVSCSCDRSLPQFSQLEGRVDDVLYTTDGRRIGRLDPVFKADLHIREAQIIQEALDVVRVLIVTTDSYTPDAGRSIIQRLQDRLGPMEVILEEVEEVPRSANGKFRAVISNVSPEELGNSSARPNALSK